MEGWQYMLALPQNSTQQFMLAPCFTLALEMTSCAEAGLVSEKLTYYMNANYWSGAIAAVALAAPMQIASASTPELARNAEANSPLDRPTLASAETRDLESDLGASDVPLLARVTEFALQQPSPELPPLQHFREFLLDESGQLAYVDTTDPTEEETFEEIVVYESGEASWYGPGFDGNYTANGEIYNQYGISAAHPSLPFGTVVRVTNVSNGRSLDVRINDRGPYAGRRVIDLSRGAAEELGVISSGVAYVEISIVE